MRNLNADATSLKPLFENPEIGAMAEICEILQALPDDAARLRVMRWSFARFGGEEFKRSPAPIAPQAARPPAVRHAAPAAVDASRVMLQTPVTVEETEEDFAHQVSELKDLFPRRPNPVSPLQPA
jgi:hypothetical protein